MSKTKVKETATVNPLPQEVITAFSRLRFYFEQNFQSNIKENLHNAIVQITLAQNVDMDQGLQNCVCGLQELYRFFGSPEIKFVADEVETQYSENDNLILLK